MKAKTEIITLFVCFSLTLAFLLSGQAQTSQTQKSEVTKSENFVTGIVNIPIGILATGGEAGVAIIKIGGKILEAPIKWVNPDNSSEAPPTETPPAKLDDETKGVKPDKNGPERKKVPIGRKLIEEGPSTKDSGPELGFNLHVVKGLTDKSQAGMVKGSDGKIREDDIDNWIASGKMRYSNYNILSPGEYSISQKDYEIIMTYLSNQRQDERKWRDSLLFHIDFSHIEPLVGNAAWRLVRASEPKDRNGDWEPIGISRFGVDFNNIFFAYPERSSWVIEVKNNSSSKIHRWSFKIEGN